MPQNEVAGTGNGFALSASVMAAHFFVAAGNNKENTA
jgi:hypothetical protein